MHKENIYKLRHTICYNEMGPTKVKEQGKMKEIEGDKIREFRFSFHRLIIQNKVGEQRKAN